MLGKRSNSARRCSSTSFTVLTASLRCNFRFLCSFKAPPGPKPGTLSSPEIVSSSTSPFPEQSPNNSPNEGGLHHGARQETLSFATAGTGTLSGMNKPPVGTARAQKPTTRFGPSSKIQNCFSMCFCRIKEAASEDFRRPASVVLTEPKPRPDMVAFPPARSTTSTDEGDLPTPPPRAVSIQSSSMFVSNGHGASGPDSTRRYDRSISAPSTRPSVLLARLTSEPSHRLRTYSARSPDSAPHRSSGARVPVSAFPAVPLSSLLSSAEVYLSPSLLGCACPLAELKRCSNRYPTLVEPT